MQIQSASTEVLKLALEIVLSQASPAATSVLPDTTARANVTPDREPAKADVFTVLRANVPPVAM